MGWTSKRTKDSFMEVFKDEYSSWFIPGGQNEIIKSIEVPITGHWKDDDKAQESEIFSAVIVRNNGKSCVYAHVLLINSADGEVYWKGQDEFVGPYTKTKCPESIMKLLSPLQIIDDVIHETGYAKEWRKRQ